MRVSAVRACAAVALSMRAANTRACSSRLRANR
jgi:hypothetical protein